jgi:hypothetical protein
MSSQFERDYELIRGAIILSFLPPWAKIALAIILAITSGLALIIFFDSNEGSGTILIQAVKDLLVSIGSLIWLLISSVFKIVIR